MFERLADPRKVLETWTGATGSLPVARICITQEGLGLLRLNTGSDPSCQSSSDEALLEEAGDRETKQSSMFDLKLWSLILLSAVLFFFSWGMSAGFLQTHPFSKETG